MLDESLLASGVLHRHQSGKICMPTGSGYAATKAIVIPQLILAISLTGLLCSISNVFASEAVATIESFRVLNAGKRQAQFVVTGTSNVANLCIAGAAKSHDDNVRSAFLTPLPATFAAGVGKFTATVEVQRPSESGAVNTDSLFLVAISCGNRTVIANRQFDWAHTWVPLTRKGDPASDDMTATPEALLKQSILAEDFKAVDVLLENWARREERDASGEWKLSAFNVALELVHQEARSAADWEANMERIRHWKAVSPGTAALAEARFWVDYAWRIRGRKNPENVDPDAMEIFYSRMAQAEQVLKSAGSLKNAHPIWYETLLRVAVETRASAESIDKLYADAVGKYPGYLPLHAVMLQHWTSNRNGHEDWEKVEQLVNRVMVLTKATDGEANYARLYADRTLQPDYARNIFKVSQASWPRMKRAFDAMIARFPSAANLNRYAVLACQANDKMTFLTLRPRVDKLLMPWLWPANYSPEACRQQFLQKI